MATKIEGTTLDLIPDFDESEGDPSAVELLRQQAQIIEKKAKDTLRALVEPGRSGGDRIAYELILEIPVITYRYKVLRIEFGIDEWPVDVSTPGAPTPRRANDQQAYTKILSEIFGAASFRNAVVNMRRLYNEELVVSPNEREVLNKYRLFTLASGDCLATSDLLKAIKSTLSIREAEDAIEGLIRRGMLTETTGAGFSLTEKGAGVAYRTDSASATSSFEP